MISEIIIQEASEEVVLRVGWIPGVGRARHFSFSFVCCFLARLHWVREEVVDGQGVVVKEHVLGSGVVEELEVVPAETEGDGGGDQQDGGRAPTEVGLPALHFLSHFSHFTVVKRLSKDRFEGKLI